MQLLYFHNVVSVLLFKAEIDSFSNTHPRTKKTTTVKFPRILHLSMKKQSKTLGCIEK